MNALGVIMIIISIIALILSLRLKAYITLTDTLAIRAGLGPVVLRLLPKKKKAVNVRDYTYKKHQKRLKKDRKTAAKKKAKIQKKADAKALAERAEKASKSAEGVGDDEKLATVSEIIKFVTSELSFLASHLHTDIRMLNILVGGDDAAFVAQKYGVVCTLSSLLIELLDNKTKLRKMSTDNVSVKADFFSEKTTINLEIQLKISLFSLLIAVFQSLGWLIAQKSKQI